MYDGLVHVFLTNIHVFNLNPSKYSFPWSVEIASFVNVVNLDLFPIDLKSEVQFQLPLQKQVSRVT